MKNKIYSKLAFTLMELLAVIVIIALIVAIAIPVIFQIISKAEKETFTISVKNILRQLKLEKEVEKLAQNGVGQNGDVSYSWVIPKNEICLSANNKKYEIVNMNCTNAEVVEYGKGDRLRITQVSGNPTEYTKENVILSINVAGGVAPYEYSFDNGETYQASNQKEFFQNSIININVKDSVGITLGTSYQVIIDKIDKENPVINLTNDYIEIEQNTPIDLNDYVIATDNVDIKRIIITGSLSTIISGIYNINYQAEDLAGNLSQILTLTIKVKDATSPVLTLSNTSNNWYNRDVTIDVTITDNEGGSGIAGYIYCLKSNGECTDSDYGEIQTNDRITISNEGQMNLSVKAIDNDGNYSNIVTRTLKIDKTPPIITVNGSQTPLNIDHSVGTPFVIPTGVASDSLSGIKGSIVTTGTVSDIIGTYTITYTVYDNANNVFNFILNVNITDTTAPTIVLTPNSPNGYGWYTSNINILVKATDNDDISSCGYKISTDGGVSYPGSWIDIPGINNTTSKTITITQESNNMKVMVRCTDASSMFNEKGTQILKLDKTAPGCTSSGGNTSWINTSRTLTGTCTDNLSGCTGNATKTYSTEINSTAESPGTVSDNAGNSTACAANQTVKIDKTVPGCTSSGGSGSWTNGNITLTGTCSDGLSGCTGNATKTYSTDTNTTTASPGSVYDNAGNSTVCPANQTVKVDKTPPGVPSVNLNGYTSNTWTNQNVSTTLSSTDALSGVSHYQYSHDTSTWTSWPSNPWTINWDGEWTFYTRAVDNAGNVSGTAPSYIIRRDTVPPSFNYFYIGGTGNPASTTSTSTTLYFSVSGATQMCISTTTSCSAWGTYASSKAYTLSTGYGTKTLYAWFKDQAGNQIGYYSDSIKYLQGAHTDSYTCGVSGYSSASMGWSTSTSTVIQGTTGSYANYYGVMYFGASTFSDIRSKSADYNITSVEVNIKSHVGYARTVRLYVGGPCPTPNYSTNGISGSDPTGIGGTYQEVSVAANAWGTWTITNSTWINALLNANSACLFINRGDSSASYWEGDGAKHTNKPTLEINWTPK